jgi:phage terminase large subunit-like protein
VIAAGGSPLAKAFYVAHERLASMQGQAVVRIDPLKRLFDESFTDTVWEYENSKVGLIPGRLHAKQIEALHNTSKHRWLFWGNQVGKTSFAAIDMALKALGRHPWQMTGRKRMPPWTGWASALTWELWEKILLPELLTWIPPWRIVDAPTAMVHSTKRDIAILADNGKLSRITGKAAEQGSDKYQSARVDDVWLDEEHPEAVWDEIQPRLLRFGGDTLGTMTPLKGMGTFIFGRIYEPIRSGQINADRHWYSHAGLRDNPGITPEARQELLEELKHNPSQLAARDEGKFVRPMGAVLPWDPEKHQTAEQPTEQWLERMRARGAWAAALDLGKWRFAMPFGVADEHGTFTLLDEYFSQNEDADTRAKGIDAMLKRWRVPSGMVIPADCADPEGINELNDALERVGSKHSVYAIPGELKKRAAGISRLESMMNRGAFKVRRGLGSDRVWRLGMSSNKPGKPVMGSRWMWEASHWQYPEMPDGKIQKDDPDDASADGADMMDGTRYLAMTYFPGDEEKKAKPALTQLERIRKELEELDRIDHDTYEEPSKREKYGTVLRQ